MLRLYSIAAALTLLSLPIYCNRSALIYFTEHRKVLNSSFTILDYSNSSAAIWLEYKYYFEQMHTMEKFKVKNLNTQSRLKVGIFETDSSPFDCTFNADDVQGYSYNIISLLKEILHLR